MKSWLASAALALVSAGVGVVVMSVVAILFAAALPAQLVSLSRDGRYPGGRTPR